ncbi:16S rRNA (cytidine(1402)-2'-O)-methyltransferase [Kineococcus aurantiacus]|uniref:Ribosomal RNA small subunit methyltransferase I n=1 Tax=Kineococcus aurantiacus TaxID=37633 RepID=A0A7Y9AU62_9ACTN|nr:16S rRNA (cytidine1402-2'-O)-methyltransferase [Kineococcus aurantiacus]
MDPTRATGRLVLAGTPIGNAGDATRRLLDLLETADVVAAEDTRRLHRLAAALEVSPRGKVLSYHEHNEAERTPELVAAVRGGATVALVTDAGMPSVSDPGYRLVRGCVEAGLPVTVVPGPSAVLAALAVSGLPSDRFSFEGFAPRRPGERQRVFAALAGDARTLIFFESPHRTAATLEAMAQAFGADRPAAVCRELTKTYEEVVRGPLGDLVAWAGAGEVRGEVCLVVQGSSGRPARSTAELVEEVAGLVRDGHRMKDAVREVAGREGVPSRELYDAVTLRRNGGDSDASRR